MQIPDLIFIDHWRFAAAPFKDTGRAIQQRPFPAGTKVWIAGGVTDMRRGINTLALSVQQGLGRDPHAGEIFCFRGRKGDLVKLLWHDGLSAAFC
ncbi:MAG: IS66 family insertion sequence element accessory protein TnpB [Rhodobacterales bacterium]